MPRESFLRGIACPCTVYFVTMLLMVSQMLRRPAPASATTLLATSGIEEAGTCEAFTVSAVIWLNNFICASVAGPATPSAPKPFFC